jgi:lysophospholipase L1-like esterase
MKSLNQSSRRNFLKQVSVLGVAVVGVPSGLTAASAARNDYEGTEYTFLFQGDSITDGNRTRNLDWNHVLGHGYQCLIASRLWYDLPKKKFHFFNRGVSGNNIVSLTRRWQTDTLDIKPDLLSILIGVNDTTNAVSGQTNFTALSYETDYRALLTQTKQALPNVQLVIMEPFIQPFAKVKEKWDDYEREMKGRQAAVKKLAAEFDAIFVPLQESFDKAIGKYPPVEYWVWDGIHPMPGGHELIAREWLKNVSKKLKFIKT